MHLREYLWKKKLTIQQFSELIGYNRHYISLIMRGSKKPSKRLAQEIEEATAGEVKAEEFLKDLKDEST